MFYYSSSGSSCLLAGESPALLLFLYNLLAGWLANTLLHTIETRQAEEANCRLLIFYSIILVYFFILFYFIFSTFFFLVLADGFFLISIVILCPMMPACCNRRQARGVAKLQIFE
jgi:hypothetical protein